MHHWKVLKNITILKINHSTIENSFDLFCYYSDNKKCNEIICKGQTQINPRTLENNLE